MCQLIADTGSGSAPIVDMGAYEAQFTTVSSIAQLRPGRQCHYCPECHVQVVFAESVSGVDTSDFALALASGHTMGASVTAVSGSGTTWQVTANLGGGAGAMRLDTSGSARVTNSTGSLVGIQPFTSSETYTFDTPPLAPDD